MKHKQHLIGLLLLCTLLILGTAITQGQDDESESVAAARDKALDIVGGAPIGGTVSMLGVLGGEELDAFLSVFAPFEEATGITVEYESTRDLGAVLQTRIDGGIPPDVVSSSLVGQMVDFAEDGTLVDLSQFLDMDAVLESYNPALLDSVSVEGQLYSIFTAVNLVGLIWYNPEQYTGPNPPATWDELVAWAQETADSGTTPWCIGLESGPASGWPGTNWINEILMRQVDAETYASWWQGTLPWSSEPVRQAFETFGSIATNSDMVTGGPIAVLATSFLNGADAMYADPPACYLHLQASFMGGIISGNFPELEAITNINFFPFPDITEDYPGVAQVSGEVMGMFNDTPQARAFIDYFASTEAQTLMAETGRWLSANTQIPAEAYPSPYTQAAAAIMSDAETIYYSGAGLMPQAMTDAFWSGILRYVQNPDELDDILNDLDAVREEAYQ
jgi:alpha-glucoside transport system substrate-binding protein